MGKTNPYLSRKIYFFCRRRLSTSEEIPLCSASAEWRKLRTLHSFLLFPTRPAALGSRGGPERKGTYTFA